MSTREGLSRLYNGQTDINFIGRWKLWFTISAVVIVIGLGGLFVRGLNLGIEFEGGVSWEVPAHGTSVAEVKDALTGTGLANPSVQSLGSSGGSVIRVQAEEAGKTDAEKKAFKDKVDAALAKVTGSKTSTISFNEVGPSWGSEVSSKALRALIVFLVLVSVYIAFRFEWRMAAATLAALLHDILITVGIYAVLGLPVTPATVIAFLTILGYSIYDGIVVFDRVDENAKRLGSTGTTTYSDMVNRSMNEVLMRTLNTSITALLPILSLLVIGSFILGATSLEEFATALFIGLLSGAYSSIFIASPVLALLKEREPKWLAVRRRLEGRSGLAAPARGPLRPSGGTATAVLEDVEVPTDEVPARPAPTTGPIQPRGRKKGKRR
ncbi:MAG: protein translocase subunit secF [Actinomycetia bacterium]|nr:protein translocase subunit secF [Actinomycetes bacterium]